MANRYTHIRKINGKKKQEEIIKKARAWTRKTYAGKESPESINTVIDLFDRDKLSEVFIRYEKTLVAKIDSTTWFETEAF